MAADRTVPDLTAVRARFGALDRGTVFLDSPGGSQVPDEVGDAVAGAMRDAAANIGAPYPTSERVGRIVEEAEANAAAWLGCEAREIAFGPNMTSLNFALSRTAARGLEAGDEVLVTALDHDGNVAPWLELAHDMGLVVREVALREDTTLDLDDLERQLGPRTRVVAFSWASNAVGTVVDARRACALAHEAGALAWVDAVHYAAHEPVDVADVDADVVICSAYKLCGPHLGVAYVRGAVARGWRPYKVRPAPDDGSGRRFATGTMPFEQLAGFNAAADYLREIGGMAAWRDHERALGQRLLDGLPPGTTCFGRPGMEGRVPTFILQLEGIEAGAASRALAERGFAVWAHDSWYSPGLQRHLGYDGLTLRVGLAHYNTADEVDAFLAAVREL